MVIVYVVLMLALIALCAALYKHRLDVKAAAERDGMRIATAARQEAVKAAMEADAAIKAAIKRIL